jgi:hypothetical protein
MVWRFAGETDFICEESGLMYNRWIRKMNQITEKLSNGKVGYVHVQGMNDGSFREVFDQVMGKISKKL